MLGIIKFGDRGQYNKLQAVLKLDCCLNFDWLCSVQIMVDIVMYLEMLPFSTLRKHEYFYLNKT